MIIIMYLLRDDIVKVEFVGWMGEVEENENWERQMKWSNE